MATYAELTDTQRIEYHREKSVMHKKKLRMLERKMNAFTNEEKARCAMEADAIDTSTVTPDVIIEGRRGAVVVEP